MKVFKSIIAAFAALTILSSCSLLTNTASGATASGTSTGSALSTLYNIFKTTGGIDLSNIGNLINLGKVLGNIGGLGNATSAFTEQFASGLISGSSNLVNANNVGAVMEGLMALANTDTSAITQAANLAAAGKAFQLNGSSEGVTSALSSLTGIFNALK